MLIQSREEEEWALGPHLLYHQPIFSPTQAPLERTTHQLSHVHYENARSDQYIDREGVTMLFIRMPSLFDKNSVFRDHVSISVECWPVYSAIEGIVLVFTQAHGYDRSVALFLRLFETPKSDSDYSVQGRC